MARRLLPWPAYVAQHREFMLGCYRDLLRTARRLEDPLEREFVEWRAADRFRRYVPAQIGRRRCESLRRQASRARNVLLRALAGEELARERLHDAAYGRTGVVARLAGARETHAREQQRLAPLVRRLRRGPGGHESESGSGRALPPLMAARIAALEKQALRGDPAGARRVPAADVGLRGGQTAVVRVPRPPPPRHNMLPWRTYLTLEEELGQMPPWQDTLEHWPPRARALRHMLRSIAKDNEDPRRARHMRTETVRLVKDGSGKVPGV